MKNALLILPLILAGSASPLLSQETLSPAPQAPQTVSSPQRASNALWARVYDDSGDPWKGMLLPAGLILTPDGGFAIGGFVYYDYAPSGWVMKLDLEGVIQWEKVFPGVEIGAIEGTSDGNMVVLGASIYNCGAPSPCADYYLIKLDLSGNILWQKRYHLDYYFDEYAQAIGCFESSDCGFILVGHRWMAKVDAQGDILWQKDIGWKAISATKTHDGGVLLARWYNESTFCIMKVAGNGFIEWQKSFHDQEDIWISSLAELQNADYIASGTIYLSTGWEGIIFFRVNSKHEVLWQWKSLNLPVTFPRLSCDSSSDYCVSTCGWTDDEHYGDIIFQFATNGDIVWQNYYDKAFFKLKIHPLKYILSIGLFNGIIFPDSFAGAKMDSRGNISPNCDFIMPADLTLKPASVAIIDTDISLTDASLIALDGNAYAIDTIEDEILICSGKQTYRMDIPAAANISGAQGALWRTDLMIQNANDSEAKYKMIFAKAGEDGQESPYIYEGSLSPGAADFHADVVADVFNLNETAGTIRIESDFQLLSSSRTFNDLPQGTFGQFIPGFSSEAIIGKGEERLLFGLLRNAAYRTNIGFAEALGQATTIQISFFSSAGMPLGESHIQILPCSWLQYSLADLLPESGAGEEQFWAKVKILSGGAVFAYAAIIDNGTGDAVFNPAQKTAIGSKERIIPVVARIKGDQRTNWRSDVCLVNVSASSQVSTIRFETSAGTYFNLLEIQPFSAMTLSDAISYLFPQVNGDIFGWMKFEADGQVLLTSSTYNLTDQGTYGQEVPVLPLDDGLNVAETGYILQLKSTTEYRCNMGFTEVSGIDAAVIVQIFDLLGSELAEKSYTLSANQNLQINGIFQDMALAGSFNAAYAVVTLESGAKVFAYASIVDNRTGDAIFVPFNKVF